MYQDARVPYARSRAHVQLCMPVRREPDTCSAFPPYHRYCLRLTLPVPLPTLFPAHTPATSDHADLSALLGVAGQLAADCDNACELPPPPPPPPARRF